MTEVDDSKGTQRPDDRDSIHIGVVRDRSSLAFAGRLVLDQGVRRQLETSFAKLGRDTEAL